ncbi:MULTISPECIES: hypothetical protein [Xanthomonas]|uniref:hypothetical protein n=1 Tax=Xanthomonas TaxID=338 RepID=UPI000C3BFBB3|nr:MULTISPECIES: hypothetical protein [Xanthomonas]ATS73517.2 hypothetical protein XcfCFBP6166P_19775 [Xanthomonas citri pv. phaseoli var. fuscans]ATS76357.2 hypothetical protein XcfCFBP6975P_11895 [Xanthomonas citri pv. phaseoli var. fuscans]ATS88414.2 hypothetical protein XcfCFBP6167P_08925 [Xanthomonas citri pv. phaseoli var. fuscans]SON98466.1 hypothetical protein XFF6960_10006 [Xanthomonas citri pv. fuscans]SOO05193.1 hypothetical protein XFF7767_380006 [Xanthomonas citri pv. fuscans]
MLLKEILKEVSVRVVAAYSGDVSKAVTILLRKRAYQMARPSFPDYVDHNEPKIALELLVYMVNERPLTLSATVEAALARLCAVYGFRP